MGVSGLDGVQILRALRETWLKRVPVIVLTSSESPRDLAQLSGLGVDRHIVKSARLEEFFAIGRIIAEIVADQSATAAAAHVLNFRPCR